MIRRRIALVNPPGAALERPSIALGIIQGILSRVGYEVTSHYENLRYAELIGVELYRAVVTTDSKFGLMDWLFSEVAFPDFVPGHQAYLAAIYSSDPALRDTLPPERMFELREASGMFTVGAASRLAMDDTAIVGCTSSFCQQVASLALLREIRNCDPDVVTMLGGANCEGIMGYTTHQLFDWVDFVVSGDAEELIVPLVGAIMSAGKSLKSLGLTGVFSPEDRILKSGLPTRDRAHSRAMVRDMRLVPRPVYDDYFDQLSSSNLRYCIRPGLLVEASRGCWWGERNHCSFCGLNGSAMQYSSKQPTDILEEMGSAVSRYKIDRIAFVDNILDFRYLHSLLPELARRETKWSMFVEIKSNLKRDHVQLLARAGIRWLQPGIESLDSRILSLMKKGSSAYQNILLLKWSRQFGIRLFWNLIFGTPGEDEGWYGEQARFIPLLMHFQPPLPVELQYCRFSPYHKAPHLYGLTLTATTPYKSIYPVSAETLNNLVYFFDNVDPKWKHNDAVPAKISPDLIAFWSAIAAWREAWRRSCLATCQRVILDEAHCVLDTRPCAIQRLTKLDECASSTLTECEDAPSRLALHDKMVSRYGFESQEVHDALLLLESRGFVLRVDDRLVSLVHTEAPGPLPNEEQFPGGYILE